MPANSGVASLVPQVGYQPAGWPRKLWYMTTAPLQEALIEMSGTPRHMHLLTEPIELLTLQIATSFTIVPGSRYGSYGSSSSPWFILSLNAGADAPAPRGLEPRAFDRRVAFV